MQVERWTITTREDWLKRRRANINGSEIGALFGFSPFMTPYALYADKAGLVDSEQAENGAMRRGRILEPAVAAAVDIERPDWQICKSHDYLWSPEFRIGCTPDFLIEHLERGPGVLQAKSVAQPKFEEDWQDGPPQWIVLQTLQEMMLSNVSWGAIGVLVTGTWSIDCKVYEFERHEGAETRIKTAAKEFWANVEKGKAPDPNWYRDDDIIKSMFPRDNGETVDLSTDNRLPVLLEEFESLNAMGKHAADKLKAVKTEIAAKIGEASAARLPGWQITNKLQHRKGYTVQDTEFRVLRVKRTEEARAAA
jgi:predicted phage-related endonuclease